MSNKITDSLDTPETQNFIKAMNQTIQSTLLEDKRFAPLAADILTVLQSDKNIAFCEEHHSKMYHFFQDESYPKGVYRVSSSNAYRAGKPDWQILFSVASFDTLLGENVFLAGVDHCTLRPDRVLISLAPDGQDAEYTVEFDLQQQKVVEGGFHFPLGKNHIHWRDENSVWVCPAWDERQTTAAGYPAQVWLLERGQAFEEAAPVFQLEASGLLTQAWRYLDGQGSPVDIIEAAQSFFQKDYYAVDNNLQPTKLHLPKSCAIVGYLNGQLLIHLQDEWQRGSTSFAAGSLLAVNLHKGKLGQALLLFAPNARQTIETVETTRSFIVLHYLDNIHSHLKAWHWQAGDWQPYLLADLPEGTIEMVDQPWGGELIYLAIENFLLPTTLLALDLAHNEISVLRKSPALFDASDFQTAQHFAKSEDGTEIPYFWIGKEANPQTPTLVYVYGGFNMPELPHYLGNLGRHWLTQGGAFVLANVRGGGEFGPSWHRAAQKQNKHKSVDDLIAVVADLIQHQRSSPNKIALQGGSNGGLLVASALTRIPEKIAAVVCEAPLTDMLHFHQYSAGSSWVEEYGDPEIPEEREALKRFSPLHQLKDTTQYPSVLLTTSLSDDRVHPLHAILFAQALQHLQQDVLLFTATEGGHTGNDTQKNTADELAMILIFLYQSLKNTV